MSDEKRSKSAAQDWLGLLFFAAGAFLAFSIAMFWIEGGERADPNPTTAVVIAAIDALGPVPSFATSLLVALLGGLMFFVPRSVSTGRHLAGLAGLLIGSALLLGAASPGQGGELGGLFDWLLDSRFYGAAASGLLGALVLAATVWIAWVPSPRRIPMKLGESAPVSAALRQTDAAGVSSAEAAALLPVNEDSEPIVPAHPIDLRLRGGSRERSRAQASSVHGTKSSTRSSEAQEGVQPAPVGRNAHERAGADLVAVFPAQGRAAAGRPGARAAEGAAARAVAADPTVRILDPRYRSGGDGIASPPTWELGGAEEDLDEASELEPTPKTEWESSTATKEVPTETEPEFAWPTDEEAPPRHEPDSEEVVEIVAEEESEDAEFWEDDDSPADDDEDEDEDEDEDDEDEDDEDEDEDEEDEEEEDADEEDEDEEDEEEDEDEDEDEDDEEEDEDEDEEDLEEWGSTDPDVTRVAAEIVPALAQEKTREPPLSRSQAGSRQPARELAPATRKPARARSAPRRSQAASGSRAKVAAGGVERSHTDLLLDAGLMIIESGRVAVSMVQREFEMDFKAATNLLDELQDRGVIGPYLGGRHRDILLSREEWIAIAPASS